MVGERKQKGRKRATTAPSTGAEKQQNGINTKIIIKKLRSEAGGRELASTERCVLDL
jgi:hypothetical protein